MAIPAFADGGPHVVPTNSGTGGAGLSGDCAGCHRAHRGQAADLLKDTLPGLCLSCHDGTGATVNVVDGIQYSPTGFPGTKTVLGALRGGGFEFALIDRDTLTGPSRLSYNSRGGITVTFSAVPTAGSFDLVWPAFGAFAGGTLSVTIPGDLSSSTNRTTLTTNLQTAANTLFGTSTTYTGITNSVPYMSSTTTNKMTVSVAGTGSTAGKVITFTPHNEFRLLTIGLPSVANISGLLPGGTTITPANGISIGSVGHVNAQSTPLAVTSTHMGEGTVWGNGPQGQGNPGASGVELTCTGCHNPHGNGQYRILLSEPGEDWSNDLVEMATMLTTALTAATDPIHVASSAGFPEVEFYIKVDSEIMLVTGGQGTLDWNVTRGAKATTAAAHSDGATVSMIISDWTAPTNHVEIFDVGSTATTKNYTIKPANLGGVVSYQAADVGGSPYAGDYWRYRYDPAGYSNFTNFYLQLDPMNTGWNGLSVTNVAAMGTGSTAINMAAGITATGTTLTVDSIAVFPSTYPYFVTVEGEIMQVTAKGTGANDLTVSRGVNVAGTAGVAHADNTPVSINTTTTAWNKTGLMTAWCITCHTRYNGYLVDATGALTNPSGSNPPSLVAQTPTDATFMFKHGTARLGCEQCHVNHGTNVTMSGPAATVDWPDGTPDMDSALLKVNNRGTCQLCHDPTGTVDAGTWAAGTGYQPSGPTPGP
jgi:predicted CXXCH cytochrome family protein